MFSAVAFLTVVTYHSVAQEIETLANGLQVVVKENHVAPVAAVRIYVKTGSISEQEFLGAGISHLFEHLINGGTTRTRTEEEITASIDRLGGANNAYTSSDHTCYYITTSAEQVGDAIDLMADWMMNSTFPQNEFDREMGVVLEELKKGREEPARIINQEFAATMFAVHPARFPTIGYEEQVTKLTRDDIVAYYNRMYAPNNMVIVAVGDFNAATVSGRIRAAFKDFERRALPAISLPAEPRQLGTRIREIRKPGLDGTYIRFGFHTVPIDDPALYALDVLSFVLSRGRSSRLVRILQEERRLVSSISTYSHTPQYDAGVFVVYGTCRDEQVDEAIAAAFEEITRTRTEPVTEDELEKAKRQKIAGDILAKQTAADEAASIGINVITTNNPKFDDVYLDGIRKVTAEDVKAVAQTFFHDDNLSIVVLRPVAESAETAVDSGKQEDRPIQKIEFPNGLRLLVKENPNVPLVNMRLLCLGGVRLEPEGQAGISRLTAEMMTRGTATRSRDDIASAFDNMGGRLTAFSANNSFGVTAEVLSEDFEKALEILADIILNPLFPESEFETVKSNTLDAIQRRSDRWDQEVAHLFRHQFFTAHPYRFDSLGEADTVSAIDAAGCREFYDNHLVPRNSVITVFGDIDAGVVHTAVREAFASFSRDAPAVSKPAPQPPPVEDREVRKTVKRQLAAVYIGYPGLSVYDKSDRHAMIVLDAVISGIGFPGGWLYQHLRGGDRDLVYVVHAFNFVGIEPGYFGIMAASSADKMDEVIDIILKDVAAIRENRVDADQLDKAKTICATMDKLDRQTNSDVSLQAAVDELYGLGYDYSDFYTDRIMAVTAEDVRNAARKYLTNYVLVRTGPEAAAE